MAEPRRQSVQHLQIGADARRRIGRPAPQDHPALQVGGGPGLLGPLRHRQDDIRQLSRLRQHDVGHRQEVQGFDPLRDPGRVRGRHHRVGAHHDQRLHLAAERVEEFVRAASGPRERVRVHAPHARDVGPGRRVRQLAVTRQLVGLLAVFPAALTVALTGETAVAGERTAGPAGGQAEVDPCPHRVRALRLLLRAACGQHHRRRRVAEQRHRLPQRGHRDTGDPLDQLRPVRHHGRPRLRPATGARRDELLVEAALRDHQVQQPQRECQIRARTRGQVQIGLLRGPRPARVDHDQLSAVLPQLRQVPQRGRHRLGEVRAHQDQAPGAGNVLQREREPPVEPERPLVRRGGRRHAEPAVVVDLRGPQHHAGELAQRVRLLVGQPAPAEHRDRVRAVGGPAAGEGVRDPVQRLVPARRLEPPAGTAHQRTGQPRSRGEQLRRGAALPAQGAPVHGEPRPFHHLEPAAGAGPLPEPHAALERAVGAVGGHLGRAWGRDVHGRQPDLRVLRRRPPPGYARCSGTSADRAERGEASGGNEHGEAGARDVHKGLVRRLTVPTPLPGPGPRPAPAARGTAGRAARPRPRPPCPRRGSRAPRRSTR